MKIEQILEKHNLLPKEKQYVKVTEVSAKVLKTKIKVMIDHDGRMGNTLDTVNSQLKRYTDLDDTIDYLDSLPHLDMKKEGSPNYTWHGEWHYKRNLEVEDPVNSES